MTENRKKVFVSGNFNIVHPGHIRLFRFARELADILIVGVLSDRLAGDDAYVPEQLRIEAVNANTWVSKSFLLDQPLHDALMKLKPDFVVKGKEHEDSYNVEDETVKLYGGHLVFSSGDASMSSRELLSKEIVKAGKRVKTCSFPTRYSERHGVEKNSLKKIVDRFETLRVCVIGDLIIDEYIECEPLGMSQEDPTIVVRPVHTERFVGGAGVVAAHSANLGAKVDFISVVGADDGSKYASSVLSDYSIDANLFEDVSRPTTIKKRFRAHSQTLLRVSQLYQGAVDTAIQHQILEKIKDTLRDCDLLVFSDFNYGCLPQDLVNNILKICQGRGLVVVADSQSSSQTGDVARFKDMDILFPTEREARLSLRNNDDGLVVIADKLRLETNARNIFLKLGSEGVLLHVEADGSSPETDRISSLNESPIDVAGAGDSLLITSAMSYAVGADIWEAACIGSICAGVQVSQLGNMPLKKNQILDEING